MTSTGPLRCAVALLLAAAACGPDEQLPPGASVTADADAPDAAPSVDADPAATTVFILVMENHDYGEIIGTPDAPFINDTLLPQALLATDYHAIATRSQPNYLYLLSGDTQYPANTNTTPTQAPYFPSSAENLVTQLQVAGLPWRTYQQSMGDPCKLHDDGRYAVRHNPFVYFSDVQADAAYCAAHVVDLTALADDLPRADRRLAWIQPDLTASGHDPYGMPVDALRTSDAWLAEIVPQLQASPGYRHGGAIFITWDEAEGRGGRSDTLVPLIVLSPRLRAPGTTDGAHYTHKALLATVEDLLGLPRLRAAVDTPSLIGAFE